MPRSIDGHIDLVIKRRSGSKFVKLRVERVKCRRSAKRFIVQRGPWRIQFDRDTGRQVTFVSTDIRYAVKPKSFG